MTVGTTPGGSTPGPQFAAKPGPTNLDLILIAALSGTAGAADVIGFLGLAGFSWHISPGTSFCSPRTT